MSVLRHLDWPVNKLVGDWESTQTTDMEELYDALKIASHERDISDTWNSEVHISKLINGDWKIDSLYGFRRRIVVFPSCVETDTFDLLQQPCKATLFDDYEQLIEVMETPKNGKMLIYRFLNQDGNLKTAITGLGVTCEITYRRMH